MSSFPSANTVILIGRVLEAPTPSVDAAGRKAFSFRLETVSGPDRISHRVVVADEFIASAMFGEIAADAVVSVSGMLGYDGGGALVRVTTQRGNDLLVLGRTTIQDEAQKPAPAQPVQATSTTQTPAPQPARPSTGTAPRPMPSRPSTPPQPAAASSPRPAAPQAASPQARPTAAAPRPSGLGGLGSMSRQPSQEADGGQPDEATPPPNNGGASRMPHRAPSAPSHPGGGFGGGAAGGRGAPLGPTLVDNDIPFAAEWRG